MWKIKWLIASQSAGNTGNNNEIISIIEELQEADIITKKSDFFISITMSVDKFGCHSHTKCLLIIRGPRGFYLTIDENYDMKQKWMSNVNQAEEDNDAVNLFTLKRKCLFLDNKAYNANGYTLYNFKMPEKETDVMSKKYVDDIVKNKLMEINNKIEILKVNVEELNYMSYLEYSKDKPLKSRKEWYSSSIKNVFESVEASNKHLMD